MSHMAPEDSDNCGNDKGKSISVLRWEHGDFFDFGWFVRFLVWCLFCFCFCVFFFN